MGGVVSEQGSRSRGQTDSRPHPFLDASESQGNLPRPKNMPRHVFFTAFRFPYGKKEGHPNGCPSFLVTRTGIEPMLPP